MGGVNAELPLHLIHRAAHQRFTPYGYYKNMGEMLWTKEKKEGG